MPLIKDETQRIEAPHAPGEWYDVRPVRAGDFEALRVEDQKVKLSIDLIASLIKAWSFDVPVTRENVALLDLDSFIWLEQKLMTLSGIRSDEEKKDSARPSSLATWEQSTPNGLASRQNLVI